MFSLRSLFIFTTIICLILGFFVSGGELQLYVNGPLGPNFRLSINWQNYQIINAYWFKGGYYYLGLFNYNVFSWLGSKDWETAL